MNRCSALPSILLLTGSLCGYSHATPLSMQDRETDSQHVSRGVVPVRLSRAIDSSKAKPGDEVTATTTALVHLGGDAIPSGTKIMGHLTDATALSKGDADSSLEMVFERVQLPGGKELPIKGVVQAIAPAPEVDAGSAAPGTMPTYGSGSGPTMPPPQVSASQLNSGKNADPGLNPNSRGVVGFRNLGMGVDSRLTSDAKQIKLKSGTQMMLDVRLQ